MPDIKFETEYNEELKRVRSRVCLNCQASLGHTRGHVKRCKPCRIILKKKLTKEYNMRYLAKRNQKDS